MNWTVADVGRLIDMDNHYYEPDDCLYPSSAERVLGSAHPDRPR